jgi:hypothetical protein
MRTLTLSIVFLSVVLGACTPSTISQPSVSAAIPTNTIEIPTSSTILTPTPKAVPAIATEAATATLVQESVPAVFTSPGVLGPPTHRDSLVDYRDIGMTVDEEDVSWDTVLKDYFLQLAQQQLSDSSIAPVSILFGGSRVSFSMRSEDGRAIQVLGRVLLHVTYNGVQTDVYRLYIGVKGPDGVHAFRSRWVNVPGIANIAADDPAWENGNVVDFGGQLREILLELGSQELGPLPQFMGDFMNAELPAAQVVGDAVRATPPTLTGLDDLDAFIMIHKK